MRVGIEGKGYGSVSEKLMYILRVDVAGEKQGSAGVPEVVEADGLGQVGAFEEFLEGSHDVVMGEGRPDGGGEDEPLILPQPRESYPLF